MIVKVLVDNRRLDNLLQIEHGLSFYIELDNCKCLVDVGVSDSYLKNAEDIGVDIAEVDYLFISHGHVDHLGGLSSFLEKNKKAQIVISSHVFSQQYFSKRKGLRNISFSGESLDKHLHRFKFISEDINLDKNIRIIANINHAFPMPKANATLYKEVNGAGMELDDFNHELVFCFGSENLLVCTGCAHNGLLNILDTVKNRLNLPILNVIGGFHLLDSDDKNQYESIQEINAIAASLKNDYPNAHFYTGHCTGDNVLKQLKSSLNEQINSFYVGMNIELN